MRWENSFKILWRSSHCYISSFSLSNQSVFHLYRFWQKRAETKRPTGFLGRRTRPPDDVESWNRTRHLHLLEDPIGVSLHNGYGPNVFDWRRRIDANRRKNKFLKRCTAPFPRAAELNLRSALLPDTRDPLLLSCCHQQFQPVEINTWNQVWTNRITQNT